jgi:3',5'-cyclic AMP phosphodiesterase CpdA
MRTVVHLADLHFGRVDQATVEPLIAAVRDINPDVVAVAGDLTQRARAGQFKEARAFLDALPSPQIVVPGNHDVPLYNVFARFLSPLGNFRRHINADPEPFHEDEEVVVLGLNTARSLTTKYGRVDERQVASVRERLCRYPEEVTKIVVTHHPFDLPEGADEREIVGRARNAIEALAACGADVLLAGHLHLSHTTHTAARYKTPGHSALVVQAGTATSTRGRGEANSFNVIRVKHPHVQIERRVWQPEGASFRAANAETFRHTPDGWSLLSDEVAAGIAFDEEGTGLQPDIRLDGEQEVG